MPERDLPHVVELLWLDSFWSHGWEHRDTILREDYSGGQVRSVGYVVAETEEWVSIAQGMTEADQLGAVLRIPKVAVVSRRILGGDGQ